MFVLVLRGVLYDMFLLPCCTSGTPGVCYQILVYLIRYDSTLPPYPGKLSEVHSSHLIFNPRIYRPVAQIGPDVSYERVWRPRHSVCITVSPAHTHPSQFVSLPIEKHLLLVTSAVAVAPLLPAFWRHISTIAGSTILPRVVLPLLLPGNPWKNWLAG